MQKIRQWMLMTLICALLAPAAHAQSAAGVHQGMIRTQGTLAAGFLTSKRTFNSETRFYLYGESEYLATDQLGINGAIYGMMGSTNVEYPAIYDAEGELFVHSLFFGPMYHFTPGQPVDLYLGFQPGLNLLLRRPGRIDAGLNGEPEDLEAYRQVSPAASAVGGVAYYGSFFHLFVQLRAAYGRSQLAVTSLPLSDLRACIGLGFNL